MGFIKSCLINKNTLELRKKLENLGYKLKGKFKDFSFIYCKNGYYSTPSVNEKPPKDYYIDCGKNEELFLAIAALRDDSDINQWFVLETSLATINNPEIIKLNYGSFIKCKRDSWFIDSDDNGNPSTVSSRNIPAHKASIDELITYFKQ